MYNNKEIANKIKEETRVQGINLKEMLPKIGMGINAISQMANGHTINAISLAKIADYLNCSTDYLLGRTNRPEIFKDNTQEESSNI